MATATKAKPNSQPAATASIDPGTYDQLPLGAIAPSPKNARKEFAKEALEQLAATIREAGIVQPLIVRPVPAGKPGHHWSELYELVAGERRYRAAKLLGLAHVPCIIRTLDDRQAMLARALENYQRQELNAIEEANEFEQLTKAADAGGAGYTQQALATELGCTQSHIANRIRLLALPAKWRARVISGEMTAGAAREVLRVLVHPLLEKSFEEKLKQRAQWKKPPVTVDDWSEAVEQCLRDDTRPLSGKHWSNKTYKQCSIFKPTDAEREPLGIVTVTIKGKQEERAANKELWEKLQTAHETKTSDQQEKKSAKASAKLSTADAKKKDKERAAQIGRRLDDFRSDWLRLLVARRLADGKASATAMTRLVLYAIAGGSAGGSDYGMVTLFETVWSLETPGSKRGGTHQADFPWSLIRDVSDRKLSEVSRSFVRAWFVDHENGEPVKLVPATIVEDLAAELSIDLADEWQVHQAGTLTERYWNLHDKAGLERLAKELDVYVKPSATKSQIVKALLTLKSGSKLPKELKAVKPRKDG